jgi:hypothetical protein
MTTISYSCDCKDGKDRKDRGYRNIERSGGLIRVDIVEIHHSKAISSDAGHYQTLPYVLC